MNELDYLINELIKEDNNWNKLNNLYEKFIKDNINKKLVLLELGVGFNTPSIIRFNFEKLAYDNKNITLIRINDRYTECMYNLSDNYISIKGDCLEVLNKIIKN